MKLALIYTSINVHIVPVFFPSYSDDSNGLSGVALRLTIP